MLCRVADDIFWMSRYVERAISVGRLIDVVWHFELDAGEHDDTSDFWVPLLGTSANRPSFGPDDKPTPHEIRHFLGFAAENESSLISCIRKARVAAQGVRESISSEMWEQLNTVYLSLSSPRVAEEAEEDPYAFYRRVRDGMWFVQGLADSTLLRDESWLFFCLGRSLERADSLARIMTLQAPLLQEIAGAGQDDVVRWLAVLRSCGAAEAYSHYYALRIEPARVIEFLLLNPLFPQSIRFCLETAMNALEAIAGPVTLGAPGIGKGDLAVRALGLLEARLRHTAVDEVLEAGLEPFLEDIQHRVRVVSEHVTAGYLRDEPQPGRLVAVARAAMIMASQQQQQ
ncbi:MAG: alpha-E domain-containing protein [Chloroflexota bacterium]